MKRSCLSLLASLAAVNLLGAEVTLDVNDDATALVVNVPAGLLTGCKLELAYDDSTGAASKFMPIDRSLSRSDWANATTLNESIPAEGAAFTVALADLGGHEFEVTVASGKGFWLDNADVTAGLFKISGAGTFAIDKTSLRAAAADFDIAIKTTVAVPAEVHDWTVRSGAAVSGNGTISVNGTYHPMAADTAAKYALKDGSKLNLSDCALPLDAANMVFADEATITVDFGSRKVKPDDQLVAWSAAPAASVKFKLMPGVVGRLGVKDDGLYFRSGIMIIIR